MLEHDLCSALAAAEAGVNGREHEHIHKAKHIVYYHCAAIVSDKLGAVGGNQIREEAEEADRRIVGDYLDDLHNAVCQIGKELRGHGLRAAGHLHTEAEDDRRDYKGQDRPAAPQLGKIRLGEEIDDHIGKTKACIDFTLDDLIGAAGQGNEPRYYVHKDRRYGGGDKEGQHRCAQHLPGSAHIAHIGDGGGDGAEHHRHHHAEHKVDKHRAQRLKSGSSRPDGAYNAAARNAHEHREYKPVILEKLFSAGHKQISFLSFTRLLY